MKFKEFLSNFEDLVEASPSEILGEGDKILVLSDLHLGNGGGRDDFLHNRDLALASLGRFYLPGGWKLVLNGDIEDLSKFDFAPIRGAWTELYDILDAFHAEGRLRRIVGNHDLGLVLEKDNPYPALPSLRYEWGGRRLLLFHGHQASGYYLRHGDLQDFALRWIARPLGIRNGSVAGDSRKRYKTERRIYRAARILGLVAIAGHTHRPLFESRSKWDSLRFTIEALIEEFSEATDDRRDEIRDLVAVYREELERMKRRDRRLDKLRSLYDEGSLLVPCYFNSGSGTGRNGFTALEIADSGIGLVHWAEGGTRPYIESEAVESQTLAETGYTRYVLRREGLARIFDRIELLTLGEGPGGPRSSQGWAAGRITPLPPKRTMSPPPRG